MKSPLLDAHATRVWVGFVACHVIVWTLIPAISLPNGLLDTIELLSMGRHPEWGYWNQPPLAAWVATAAAESTGGALWGVYLAGQTSVLACFWAVWRLARDVLSPSYAALCVLLLEGIRFYSYDTPGFSNNVLQVSLWAVTVLLLWRSLNSGHLGQWLLCGTMVGLGLMNKYDLVFLLLPFVVLVLFHPQARRHLGTPGPYIALGVAALIGAPHVIWLFEHDFRSITYALARATSGQTRGAFLDHLVHPLTFALGQALVLAPAFVMVGVLVAGSPSRAGIVGGGFTRAFLFTAALGPFLTYLLVSTVTGFSLTLNWGTPLWSFIGVFLLYVLRPTLAGTGLRRFRYVFLGLALAWVIAFVGQMTVRPALTGRVSRGHFPGRALAVVVTSEWVKQYGTPLPIAAGNKWFAENISVYSPDHPDVYADLDRTVSPWTSDEDLKRRGGVIVWGPNKDGSRLPEPWGTRFPNALVQPIVSLPWQTRAAVPPVQIGWAIVAPASSSPLPK